MAKSKRPFRKPGDIKKKPSVKVDMPGHADIEDVSKITEPDGMGITKDPMTQVDVPGHRDYLDEKLDQVDDEINKDDLLKK